MRYEQLQEIYSGADYYWGTEPNGFAAKVLGLLGGRRGLRALDLGAGEGRDAVFFAGHGLDTLAIDISPNGLQKAERLARNRGMELETRQGDVNFLELDAGFDLVYSIGTVQYIEPDNRGERFEHLKEITTPGGIHAILTFVDHPHPTGARTSTSTLPVRYPSTTKAGSNCTRRASSSTTTPVECRTSTPSRSTSSGRLQDNRSPVFTTGWVSKTPESVEVPCGFLPRSVGSWAMKAVVAR